MTAALPQSVVDWARRVVSQPWHSARDKQAARDLLAWAGKD